MAEVDDVQHKAASAHPWYRRWQAWAGGMLALVVAAAGVAAGLAATSTTGNGTGTGTTPAPATTSNVAAALTTATTVEREAKATYDAVLTKFGDVQPFSTVSDAEGQHLATLADLASRYGVSLPSGSLSGETAPTTLTAACEVGVATEENLVSTYAQVRAEVSAYADLTQAFSNLQAAERDNHLPAFERCVSSATPTSSGPLPAPATESSADVALTTASTAEQEAKATYDAVLAKFGDVRPFSTVSDAEGQHLATLGGLAARYGVSLPSGPFSAATVPSTLTAACQAGVATEENQVSMYAQLLSEVSGYTDLTQAFSNLQAAERIHLMAFERCA